MPSKKKKENVYTNYKLTRQPLRGGPEQPVKEPVPVDYLYEEPRLYPDLNLEFVQQLKLNAEKENMDFSSSDDSPEKKFPYNLSPGMRMKNNSPSSPDSMQDLARRRSGGYQQKLRNRFQDIGVKNTSPESRYSENSDVEKETDDFVGTDYPHNQRRETSESPEFDRHGYSIEPQGLNANQSLHPSDSEFCSFFAKGGRYLIILFCMFFLVSFFMVYGYPTPSRNLVATSYENDQLSAATLMDSLKSKFEDQPPLTFRIIGSALKNVLGAQPKSPAIILLLATNGSQTICSHFALSLVDSLSVPKHTVKIFGENYKEANADHAKMEIDQIINNALKMNHLGSVLISDLDQIPGQSAIILHKYYDHENAPFKKAVFVMTVNYNKPISDYSDTREWDKAAYDHLLSIWTDTGVDQVTALLSRLTVSVAVIRTKTL